MSGPRKATIVTGASQGMGAGIVKALVKAGFNTPSWNKENPHGRDN